jgi:drug/metabolite transporter (DMT)-like permease
MTSAPLARAPAARLYGNAYLLLALAGLCWSGNHILGRAIAGQVPPFAVACGRYFLAALILYPFARAHLRTDWPVIRARLPLMIFLSAVGGGLFAASQYLGLQLTTAMNVSVMNSLGPALIAAVAAVMFGDRLTGRQMLGIAVSLIGVLAIITRLDASILTTLGFNWGDLLILFNMLLWAVYSATLRLRPNMHWTSFVFVFALISGITTLPLWAWEHAHGFTLQPTWLTAFTFVYVTIFSTIAAVVFWNRGVELIGANRAGIFLHLIPIYSALLTGAVLGEPLMSYHVVGFALILAGVWLAARGNKIAPPAEV